MIDFSPLGQKATEKFKKLLSKPVSSDRKAFFIDKSFEGGRRLVIPDIHGCYQTFTKLLSKIKLRPEDQLFLLGDIIDRGPYSYNVIIKIWELLNQDYQIFVLRGNHEQLFIDLSENSPEELISFAEKQYTKHLLTKDLRFRPVMREFFRTLPFYYETDSFFLVHAGFNHESDDPFTAYSDMLWIRSFEIPKSVFREKRVIHGHVPTKLEDLKSRVANEKKRIVLDNGSIRAGRKDFGNLICFNLDTSELISQRNIDLIPI